MMTRLLALLSILLLCAGPNWAQDPESPPAPRSIEADDESDDQPDPNALLSKALLALRNSGDTVVHAKIEKKGPADGMGGMQGRGGAVIVQIGGATVGDTFEGEVEAWRDREGETVVVSTKRLPGFGLYVGQGESIKQVTYEETPPSFAQLEAELIPLLDTGRFLGHVMNAKFTHGRDPETGDFLFRGPIDKNIVDPTPGGMAGFMPTARVLRCEARFRVTTEGVLKSGEIQVVRNDPMAEMRARGGFRLQIPGAQQPKEEERKAHDIEGGSSVYSLTYGRAKPSERALEFKRRIQRMLGAAKADD